MFFNMGGSSESSAAEDAGNSIADSALKYFTQYADKQISIVLGVPQGGNQTAQDIANGNPGSPPQSSVNPRYDGSPVDLSRADGSRPGMPGWVMPVLIGGGVLLAIMVLKRR